MLISLSYCWTNPCRGEPSAFVHVCLRQACNAQNDIDIDIRKQSSRADVASAQHSCTVMRIATSKKHDSLQRC